MHLKNLLVDEDAVSPVIGVILMVAVTVILAAVIASFVLGLGNQGQSVAPEASLTIDYDDSTNPPSGEDGNLTVEHESGDSIISDKLFLRGTGFYEPGTNQSWAGYEEANLATTSTTKEGAAAVGSGDEADFGANTDYDINVVWESEGDSSTTLASDTGPDA